jgi:hypothetical protein
MWKLIVKEHKYQEVEFYNSGELRLVSLGFSNFKKAREILLKEISDRPEKIIVVNYFNFINPCIFLIHNGNTDKSLHLGYIGLRVTKGITIVRIFKFDFIQIITREKIENLIEPVLDSVFTRVLFLLPSQLYFEVPNKNEKGELYTPLGPIEIWEYNLYFSKYLKNVYVFYFYFPLISILLLSIFYSKKLMISFLYFFEMPVLFSPKLFFSSISLPFAYFLDKFLNIKDPTTLKNLSSIVGVLLFLIFYSIFLKRIFDGLKLVKKEETILKEKFIILFFLLFPIFLRF